MILLSDIVACTFFFSKTIPPSEPLIETSSHKDKDKEKDTAFVNNKIAAFETRKNSSSDEGVTTTPTKRRMEKKWQSAQEPPPDVIANGIKVNEVSYIWIF